MPQSGIVPMTPSESTDGSYAAKWSARVETSGFSRLGRVEYALNGGRINTDFIDNSGGVNCSDLEVNIMRY
jgi:hypothetical protein